MNKTLSRYNKSIIAIGNLALENLMFDFNNYIDYLKYIRLQESKDTYNRLLEEDLFVSQSIDETKEILNKISFK